MEDFKKNINNTLYILGPKSTFSFCQKEFLKDIFRWSNSELASSDLNKMTNLRACSLTTVLKDEYRKIISSNPRYTEYSIVNFRKKNKFIKKCIKQYVKSDEDIDTEIHEKLVSYYNDVVVPVLNTRDDFSCYKGHIFLKINKKC